MRFAMRSQNAPGDKRLCGAALITEQNHRDLIQLMGSILNHNVIHLLNIMYFYIIRVQDYTLTLGGCNELSSKDQDGRDLTVEEAESLMGEIFSSATDAQIGSILIALRIKGESVSEIADLPNR